MSACATLPQELPTDRYLSVAGGVRLRYRDQGHGPALLLVHGWTLDLEMWDAQVAAWRDAFRVVRVDRRGHGLSGGRDAATRDAEDLAALCRHLGLARVAVLGMSQGVRSALALAAGDPARVTALILDGPPELAHSTPEDDVPLKRYQALLKAQGIEAFRREWARHPLMQLRARTSQPLLAAMIARYRGEDLQAPASSLEPEASGLALGSIAAAALVVSGELDIAARVHAADRLCAQLPRGERAVIPGAGHLANLDNSQSYNQRCRTFLTHHLHGCTAL